MIGEMYNYLVVEVDRDWVEDFDDDRVVEQVSDLGSTIDKSSSEVNRAFDSTDELREGFDDDLSVEICRFITMFWVGEVDSCKFLSLLFWRLRAERDLGEV